MQHVFFVDGVREIVDRPQLGHGAPGVLLELRQSLTELDDTLTQPLELPNRGRPLLQIHPKLLDRVSEPGEVVGDDICAIRRGDVELADRSEQLLDGRSRGLLFLARRNECRFRLGQLRFCAGATFHLGSQPCGGAASLHVEDAGGLEVVLDECGDGFLGLCPPGIQLGRHGPCFGARRQLVRRSDPQHGRRGGHLRHLAERVIKGDVRLRREQDLRVRLDP